MKKVNNLIMLTLFVIFMLINLGIPVKAEINSKLQIDVTTEKEEYDVKDEVKYSIKLDNNYGSDLIDINVKANIPEGIDVISTEGEANKGNITWRVDSIKAGETVKLEFILKVDKGQDDDVIVDIDKPEDDDQDKEVNVGVNGWDNSSKPNNITTTGGANSILTIGVGTLLVIGGALFIIKSKKGKKIISIFVVCTISGGLVFGNTTTVKAEIIDINTVKAKTVKIGGKAYNVNVEATAKYKANEDELIVKAERFLNNVILKWNFNEDFIYKIERGADADSLEVISEEVTEKIFTDILNSNEENAYYRVLAYKDEIEVAKSAIVEISGSKDSDNDGLTNYEEILFGSDPTNEDSDFDGLLDGKEIELGTDPLNPDSNGNGILDGDGIFNIEKSPEGEEVDENVSPTINIALKASQVDSFEIKKISEDDIFLSSDIPGYIGSGYDFTVDGTFDSASLTYEFNTELSNNEGFEPRIYYFNEEEQFLEELENQVVEGNKVTATITHFSKYILLNKIEFDKVWENEIKPPSSVGDADVTTLDIALVIDSSGSMWSNDRDNLRIETSKLFVDKLQESDRAAVVDFDSYSYLLSGFTSDKEVLKAALDRIDDNGGTAIYNGIITALDEFDKITGETIDFVTDTDKDGISDYYEKAISEGKVTLGSGKSLAGKLDPNNSDTDGDGLLDGQELFISEIGNKVYAKYKSDPTNKDSDYDGYSDYEDSNPLVWDISHRDLSMCADIVYHDLGTTTNFDTTTWKNTINDRFGPKAKLEELKGWSVWDTHYSYGELEAAYKKDKNLIVAYRGSEANNLFDFASDWIVADFLGWFTGFNAQVPAAKSFIAKVMKENPGYNIYVTGHSLGGSLAYNAASKAVDVNSNGVKNVTVYNGLGLVLGVSVGIFDVADERNLLSIADRVYSYKVDWDVVSRLPLTFHYGTEINIKYSKDLEGSVIKYDSLKAHSLYSVFESIKPLGRF